MHSENVLTLFNQSNKFANANGMQSFPYGAHRQQVSHVDTGLEKSRVQSSQGIIPRQAGNTDAATLSGETPMGALRLQTPKVKYQVGMTERMDPASESEVSKFWSPNPNNHAGSGAIDIRRQATTASTGRHDRHTEGIMPLLQDHKEQDKAIGFVKRGYFGLGPCRQVITPVQDTFFSEISKTDEKRSMNEVPWANRGLLETQGGTGGFSRTRDVVDINN